MRRIGCHHHLIIFLVKSELILLLLLFGDRFIDPLLILFKKIPLLLIELVIRILLLQCEGAALNSAHT